MNTETNYNSSFTIIHRDCSSYLPLLRPAVKFDQSDAALIVEYEISNISDIVSSSFQP